MSINYYDICDCKEGVYSISKDYQRNNFDLDYVLI